jgi:hypothetical protein
LVCIRQTQNRVLRIAIPVPAPLAREELNT